MRITILAVLLSIIAAGATAQAPGEESAGFILDMSGIDYDAFSVGFMTDSNGFHTQHCMDEGNGRWSCRVPRSIYEQARYTYLWGPLQSDSIYHTISLWIPDGNDTIKIGSPYIPDGSVLKMKYVERFREENVPFFNNKTHVSDRFILDPTDNPGIVSAAKAFDTNLFDFYESRTDYNAYCASMDEYEAFIKEYPSCRSSISRLASRMGIFRKRDDIRRMFECFTPQVQDSYYGRRIKEYIDNELFDNMVFPNAFSGEPERIIANTDKYNLVVFSASWCAPCHALIPLLKEVDGDLEEHLDITYVSIDEPSTQPAWRELIEEKDIAWRSVFAHEDFSALRNKFALLGVPHMLLVKPDGTYGNLDLRLEDQREILYRTVKEGL